MVGIMVIPQWRGTQEEFAEFLAAVRAECKQCGLSRTFRTPCKDHRIEVILGAYSQRELDLLVGLRRAPFWRGQSDRWSRKEA